MLPRDARRFKSRFEKLIPFLGHDDAGRVTRADIIRWRDHRLAQNISIKTINKSHIASFSSVFAWGADDRGWISHNPAADAKIKTERRKAETREEYFTREEAAAILRCADEVAGSERENQKTTAAKRWVPWLCAYSGARVAEMIQLRKQDLRKDRDHGWVIRLTPEAGNIKNNTFCDVPVEAPLVPVPVPGEVIKATVDGEAVILIGTVPGGYTVILCQIGWRTFQNWKLTTFRLSKGSFRVAGKGRATGFAAARFLLNASGNHAVFHRNGNPFDIRLSNIVGVPRGLIKQAKIEASRPPAYRTLDVHWGVGRSHAGVPVKNPSAAHSIAAAIASENTQDS